MICLMSLSFCSKEKGNAEESENSAGVGTRYTRYAVALYSKPGSKDRSDWVVTLTKGEEIKVLGTEKIQKDKKEIEFSKVEATGGKVGYVESKFLAEEIGVFLKQGTLPEFKNRPVVTANRGYGYENLEDGTLVAIQNMEKEGETTWLEISGNSSKGYFNGWVPSQDVRTDRGTITDSLLYERAINLIKKDNASATDLSEAKEILQNLAESDSNMSALAKKTLSETESSNSEGATSDAGTQSQEAAPAEP